MGASGGGEHFIFYKYRTYFAWVRGRRKTGRHRQSTRYIYIYQTQTQIIRHLSSHACPSYSSLLLQFEQQHFLSLSHLYHFSSFSVSSTLKAPERHCSGQLGYPSSWHRGSDASSQPRKQHSVCAIYKKKSNLIFIYSFIRWSGQVHYF